MGTVEKKKSTNLLIFTFRLKSKFLIKHTPLEILVLGTLFKADCKGYVNRYDDDTDSWDPLGHRKSFSIAADDKGVPWIVSNPKKVFRWDEALKKWFEMGIEKAYYVSAGEAD